MAFLFQVKRKIRSSKKVSEIVDKGNGYKMWFFFRSLATRITTFENNQFYFIALYCYCVATKTSVCIVLCGFICIIVHFGIRPSLFHRVQYRRTFYICRSVFLTTAIQMVHCLIVFVVMLNKNNTLRME